MGEATGAVAYGRPETLALGSLSLDREEALRYVGYAGQALDAELRERFDRLADACERDLRPACVCAAFPVDGEHTCWGTDASREAGLEREADVAQEADREAGGAESSRHGEPPQVVLAGTRLTLPGHDIARHLEGAREVVLMACTLGVESERELRKHSSISSVDALLYGAAASALVEAAAEAAECIVARRAAERGLQAGSRYSPGYGDLTVAVLRAFLDGVDARRRIGLSVTEGNLLVPVKSVTAVVGLFDDSAPRIAARAGCDTCNLRAGCPFREKGTTCHGS